MIPAKVVINDEILNKARKMGLVLEREMHYRSLTVAAEMARNIAKRIMNCNVYSLSHITAEFSKGVNNYEVTKGITVSLEK